MNYEELYEKYLKRFNTALKNVLSDMDKSQPKIIRDAMEYALTGGGKRIRPVLCYAVGETLGVKQEDLDNFAVAIEMIHTYSLIHDDLPAMDNDDYRRGRLSTHKKFGEAYGILTGDSLLNLAVETCLFGENITENRVKATKIIFECSGYKGMISGQVLDLENENNQNFDEKILYEIYEKKTAKLLTAPLLVASVMANGKYFDELREIGYNLGILFQITDDILDVEGDLSTLGKTPNKDEREDKYTSVKFFGLDGAKRRAKIVYEKLKVLTEKIENGYFISQFIDKIYSRKA